MTVAPLTPPIKCQGIKTKLVGRISGLARERNFERWVEPFCGSCVVALNVQPERALLADSNEHIIGLYRDIQARKLTSSDVRAFLGEEGEKLRKSGEAYYYEVRERFNAKPSSLDFLFLNRSCFNGVMRFNKAGKFNVPYCHKPERFARAYISKIANQVKRLADVVATCEWEFRVADFRDTLGMTGNRDFVYADPPYAGRHVDYFNSWSDSDESELASLLKRLPCDFILSTWDSNIFRTNNLMARWDEPRFTVLRQEHYYHVGSKEALRHAMTEALITNFATYEKAVTKADVQGFLFRDANVQSLHTA